MSKTVLDSFLEPAADEPLVTGGDTAEEDEMLDRSVMRNAAVMPTADQIREAAAQRDAQVAAVKAQEFLQRVQLALNIVGLDKTKSGVNEALRGQCNDFLSTFLAKGVDAAL